MSEQLISTPGVFGDNGNFLLERELGAGGMGGVYMGRDKMLDRPVAVKVMLRELGADAEFVEKFKKEAQSAAKLIHPNIAQVYSYGISDGMPYIAMELASGGSLYSIMNAAPGKTDIQRVLKICQQVAQALQCASDQGFVHGDVKPENILLDANGNAKLVDFGLAGMQRDTDEIWGTPYYIAPEKVRKEQIDFRADMYSLGGTLYHALTGVAPFEGSDPMAVVKKRFEGTPKKPSEIRPEISPAIDAMVMKMLALDKNDRYPSFEALIQAFKEVLASGLTQKVPASGGAKPRPGAKRTIAGARRMMLRSRPGTTSSAASDDDETEKGDGKEEEEEGNLSPRAKMRRRLRRPQVEEEEEEEEGGNLGVKVTLFVIIGLLLIGGIGGGLVWFVHHNEVVKEETARAKRADQIAKARAAISNVREKTEKFNDDFQSFTAKASVECEKFTAELAKSLPAYADQFRPPPTKKLLDAIASTNVVPKVVETNAVAAATTNAAPAAAATAAGSAEPKMRSNSLAARAKKYGLKMPDTNDPADPDYRDFLEALKNAEAGGAPAAKEEEAPAENETAEAEQPPPPPPPEKTIVEKEKDKLFEESLPDIHEVWNRTYDCQAGAIRIGTMTKKVLSTCDEAGKISGIDDEQSLDALAELSRKASELHNDLVGSQEVDEVRKGIAFIKSKGKKTIDKVTKRLRSIKLNEERRLAKIEAEIAESNRLAKVAAERKALADGECSAIRERFEAITAQGCLRQLDWDSAYRMLKEVYSNFKTPEGEIAAKFEVKKVDMMKSVQDIFLKHMVGHKFKGLLKGAKVVEATPKDILIIKADGKSKQRIQWQKFYKEYPGNFNELIIEFIIKGRKNSGLNLRDWSDAMLGAALTMKLVCAEVNNATTRAQQLAQEVIKQYPDYEKTVKDMFPDFTFDDAGEEQ